MKSHLRTEKSYLKLIGQFDSEYLSVLTEPSHFNLGFTNGMVLCYIHFPQPLLMQEPEKWHCCIPLKKAAIAQEQF